jgi:hypothetical protein
VITNLIKGVFILLNMAGFVLFNNMNYQDVSVSVSSPGEILAGESFEVEVTIEKGELMGFARYQVELPNGLIATPIDPVFADFSFRDNVVKLIWLSLPEQETFTIKYAVQVNERLKGNLELQGTFSFIQNNQRQQAEPAPALIAIQPSPNVEPWLVVDINEAEEKLATPLPHLTAGRQIAMLRQVPYPGETNELIVNLVVNREDIAKYAKIEEIIPEGYIAANLDSKGGIFTFNDQTVKYIWMDLPREPVFTVSYMLKPVHPDVSPAPQISGSFSYLINDITQSVLAVQAEFDPSSISRDELIALTTTGTPDQPVETPTQPIAEAISPDQQDVLSERPSDIAPVAERRQLAARTELMNQLDPESDVYYRVQVAAGHRPVNIPRYFKRLNIQDDVRTEMHEGWIKYSIGSFYEYKAARDYRVHIWNTTPVNDAFVAAYHNGNRITVQEALMIANHEWYR